MNDEGGDAIAPTFEIGSVPYPTNLLLSSSFLFHRFQVSKPHAKEMRLHHRSSFLFHRFQVSKPHAKEMRLHHRSSFLFHRYHGATIFSSIRPAHHQHAFGRLRIEQ